MIAPVYSAEDFLKALQNLLPRGVVWSRSSDSVLTGTLSGLAPVWARHVARNNNLLVDAFPTTSFDLLSEWESTLGLPDPCAGASPTLQGRRNQVLARLTTNGGQSIDYFVSYAANLGYTISIKEYTPLRCGQQRCGDPVGSQDWAHAWSILSPENTVTLFKSGLSGAGEPLESWGNAVLECELNEIKPAHTVLTFIYTGNYVDSGYVADGYVANYQS